MQIKEKKAIRVKLESITDGHGKAALKELEERFYTTIEYRMLLRHFHIVYDAKNPEFVFTDFNYSPNIDTDYVTIQYMGEPYTPDFNAYDYSIGFHHMKFQDRYARLPLILRMFYSDLFNEKTLAMRDFPAIVEDDARNILSQKDLFCGMIVSNLKYSNSMRFDFFHELSKYKKVSSGGRAYNNVGGPIESVSSLYDRCKFVMAFENSSIPGYVTEKIAFAFRSKAIPIYWGAPDISDFFNPKSFINVDDYNSFDEVINKIKEIDQNDDLWVEMLTCKEKLNTEYANILFNNVEDFLVHICSQIPANAKRLNRVPIDRKNAYDMWQMLNNKQLSTSMVEKVMAKILRKKS